MIKMAKSHSIKSYNYTQEQNQEICDRAMNRFDELMATFGIEFEDEGKMFIGECPVHGGDNVGAINIYNDEGGVLGFWQCHTHQCEQYFISSLIGLVRGILSHQEYGWNSPDDKQVDFQDAVKYVVDFLGNEPQDKPVNPNRSSNREFIKLAETLKGKEFPNGVPRQNVKQSLQIPAEYYLNRGFSPEVLTEYDVGLCISQDKPMTGRVVVPIYDDEHKIMIGCTGRSIFSQCKKCNGWHNPLIKCEDSNSKAKKFYPKWKHSYKFKSANHLYNYWSAKQYILKSGVAVIVESPGNCWRLCEAGIKNCVGLFGVALSNEQKRILDASGAMTLIVIMDNDEAGRKGALNIQKQCSRLYRLYFPTLDANDIGEMSVDKITSDIGPVIEEIRDLYSTFYQEEAK